MYSRSRREEMSGMCSVAVAPFIAELDAAISNRVLAAADEATQSLVRAAVRAAERTRIPMAEVLARTEAAASSQIEHVEANVREISAAAMDLPAGADARETVRNVRALRQALDAPWPPTLGSIAALQSTLMAGDPVHPTFRDRLVWIGAKNSSPLSAEYIAPEAADVPALIDDWVAFAQRTDMPALAQTAIAHAQFEGIHPFEDGNGRTGRALVHTMLKHHGVLLSGVVPISAGLLSEQLEYVDALVAYRRGFVGPIVEVFANAALRASALTEGLIDRLDAVGEAWRGEVSARDDSGVWEALAAFQAQPMLNVARLRELSGLNSAAAYRAVEVATSAGLVVEVSGGRRNQVWEAPDVVHLFDEFTRAARRGYW
jgi:Fic family protein